MKEVVILSAARTPIGSLLGTLSSLPAPRLGAVAIKAAIERAGIDPAALDQVLMGNVLQAGVGQAPARQAMRYAGVPDKVGAITVNKVCGSGMRAIMDGVNSIKVGEYDMVVAGGMESMSNAPHMVPGSRRGTKMGDWKMVDAMIIDGLWDPYGNKHMGNCGELCAAKYKLTREMQDAFALESFNRAKAAITSGHFKNEIVAVEIADKKGSKLIDQDENPMSAPLEKMASLKPAFDPNGTITAANAPPVNDGAAALVIASADKAKALGKKPLAKIVAQGSFAQEPDWFTTAPSQAAKLALSRAGLTTKDIGRWEVNEAFAVVAMAFMRDMEVDHAKVNVHGGAVALGHPIGASGARIVTTLVHELIASKQRYGVAAICLGGGEGTALVIENLAL
ncbi:MAG: acetyl-CoA C-acyltransferase [Myxococcota bacterium]|nr:thiolase family protein [Myxococcota bacterium]